MMGKRQSCLEMLTRSSTYSVEPLQCCYASQNRDRSVWNFALLFLLSSKNGFAINAKYITNGQEIKSLPLFILVLYQLYSTAFMLLSKVDQSIVTFLELLPSLLSTAPTYVASSELLGEKAHNSLRSSSSRGHSCRAGWSARSVKLSQYLITV